MWIQGSGFKTISSLYKVVDYVVCDSFMNASIGHKEINMIVKSRSIRISLWMPFDLENDYKSKCSQLQGVFCFWNSLCTLQNFHKCAKINFWTHLLHSKCSPIHYWCNLCTTIVPYRLAVVYFPESDLIQVNPSSNTREWTM